MTQIPTFCLSSIVPKMTSPGCSPSFPALALSFCTSPMHYHLPQKNCCSSISKSCPTLFATPWTSAHQTSLSFTISQTLLKLVSINSVMPSNHLILCHPLLLLLSLSPRIRFFSSESALCIRWPKYWSFSFSISPSSEYSGLISFRVDLFYFLVVQGILKNLGFVLSQKSVFLRCLFPLLDLCPQLFCSTYDSGRTQLRGEERASLCLPGLGWGTHHPGLM